jgi:hypothetical protein
VTRGLVTRVVGIISGADRRLVDETTIVGWFAVLESEADGGDVLEVATAFAADTTVDHTAGHFRAALRRRRRDGDAVQPALLPADDDDFDPALALERLAEIRRAASFIDERTRAAVLEPNEPITRKPLCVPDAELCQRCHVVRVEVPGGLCSYCAGVAYPPPPEPTDADVERWAADDVMEDPVTDDELAEYWIERLPEVFPGAELEPSDDEDLEEPF